jgi:hypothetical protein
LLKTIIASFLEKPLKLEKREIIQMKYKQIQLKKTYIRKKVPFCPQKQPDHCQLNYQRSKKHQLSYYKELFLRHSHIAYL